MWNPFGVIAQYLFPKNGNISFDTDTNTGTMTIHNDTLQDVNIDVNIETPGSGGMKTPYPNTTIRHESGVTNQIEGSTSEQSWFDLTFNGNHQIHTELNHGDRRTTAEPRQFDDGKVAMMVSQISFESSQLNYFIGPGLLQSLINSVIQANVPAIMAYINAKCSLGSGVFSVTFAGTKLDAADLVCPYAAVTNVTQKSIDINAIVRLRKASSSHLSPIRDSIIHSIIPPLVSAFTAWATRNSGRTNMTASLEGLAIMVRFCVDLTTQGVTLKEIKFSIEDFSLPTEVWTAIVALRKPWMPTFPEIRTASRLSIYLNQTANQKIMDIINGRLEDFKLPNNLKESCFIPQPSTTIDNAQPSDGEFSCWMSSSDIQDRLLKNVHLPGTHDSGAYGLTTTLPETRNDGNGIKYSDISFLWGLKPKAAPPNGNMPFSRDGFEVSEDKPIYIGQPAMDFVIQKFVLSVSKTGERNILQQLKDGIRWFDLRIYLDSDGDFYMQHGLKGPAYTDILTQVKTFIDLYPSAQELIFLNLSHANFKGDNLQKVADLTKSIIPTKHLLHKGNEDGTSFNFQSLADTTVGSLTQSTTKVMIINQDIAPLVDVEREINYPFPITNTCGFGGAEGQPLWHMGWCRTPTTADIVPYIIDAIRGEDRLHLKALATEKNGQLKDRLSQLDHQKPTPNVIDLDWYHLSSKELPVPQVIRLNKEQNE